MSAVYSMTGFSNVETTLVDGRSVSVRIKSVNARHLEMQVRVPAGLDALEPELRTMIKHAVRRGHVELTAFVERGASGTAVQVDQVLLGGYIDAYRTAAKRFGLDDTLDLHALLRIPGVMTTGAPGGFDQAAAELLRATSGHAIESFNRTRAEEGAALAGELRAGAERMAQMTEEAGRLRREVGSTAVERLRGRLVELTGESVEVGPERLLAEAALLVARGDVEEELVRLRTHLQRFTALLNAGGEVGKPLEFLLQELYRGEHAAVEDRRSSRCGRPSANRIGTGDEGGARTCARAGAESGVKTGPGQGGRDTLAARYGWDPVHHFGSFGVR